MKGFRFARILAHAALATALLGFLALVKTDLPVQAPLPKPGPSIGLRPHCTVPNQFLAWVDMFLDTRLAQAQVTSCATLTAQCQGPYSAFPGFAVSWDDMATLPQHWRAQLVMPRQDVVRQDSSVQAASQGWSSWQLVNPLTQIAPFAPVDALARPVDSYGNRIQDNNYYEAALNYNDLTHCACPAGVDCNPANPGSQDRFPDCPLRRTVDLNAQVSAASCPWQANETQNLTIPCTQRTVLYSSPLRTDRGGNTGYWIDSVEITSVSPTLTATASTPPLRYEGTFSDGSTATIWMDGNNVLASRTSPPGGVCDPPPPALGCAIRINGLINATWQSGTTLPNLTWVTSGGFVSGQDTLTLAEYDGATNVRTGRSIPTTAGSSDPPNSPLQLSGLPRVRPGEASKTLKYIATAADTGAPNGSVAAQSGDCLATLTITDERQPLPPGNGTCVLSACNEVTCSWSPVADATRYLIETYQGPNFARINGVNPPQTQYTVTPLGENTSYTFRLRTVDNSENISALSAPIPVTTGSCGPGGDPDGPGPLPGGPGGGTPEPPTLTVTARPSCNEMALSWTDSTTETSYEIHRSLYPGPPAFYRTLPSSGTSPVAFTDTGLTGSTVYSYLVKAINANGPANSNTVTRQTSACGDGGPPPPGDPNFVLSAVPPSRTINPGQATVYTPTVTATNLPNTAVDLSISGLPSGASASFVQSRVTTPPADGPVSTTLNISTQSSTPLGSYPLRITGVGAGITRTADVTLILEQLLEQPNRAPCVGRCDGSSPPGPPTDGLMCSTPPLLSFAFIYDDPDGNPASKFSFQVASDAGFSNLIADRQNVASTAAARDTITQLVEVRRGGGAGMLDYNTSYFWRAQVWDSQGAASGWSSGIAFTTPNHAYPQVDFITDRSNLNASGPTTVQFTDQTAVAPGARIVRWFWNFVAGVATAPDDQDASADKVLQTRPPTTNSKPSVVYSGPGAKTITLTAQDDGGPAFSCSRTKVLFSGTGANLQWREIKAR